MDDIAESAQYLSFFNPLLRLQQDFTTTFLEKMVEPFHLFGVIRLDKIYLADHSCTAAFFNVRTALRNSILRENPVRDFRSGKGKDGNKARRQIKTPFFKRGES